MNKKIKIDENLFNEEVLKVVFEEVNNTINKNILEKLENIENTNKTHPVKYIKSKFIFKLRKLGLKTLYKYITEHNTGGDNPYHNNYHLKQVCAFVIKGCEYYEINKEQTKLLAIAALFHDFDHSGGKFKNDDDNVNLSIKGFLKWSKLPKEDNEMIISLIKTTRYPYTNVCEDITELEKIIRDSDILQGIFSKDYFNKIVYALADEIGVDRKKMLEGQIGFLESSKFCTDWANNLYKGVLDKTIENVKKEMNVYKGN
jgi:hypothetical protein